MNIKIRLHFLLIIVLSVVSRPSFCLVPGYENNSNPIMRVYGISTSFTAESALHGYLRRICQPGTLDIFTDQTEYPYRGYNSAYYCIVTPGGVAGLSSSYNLFIGLELTHSDEYAAKSVVNAKPPTVLLVQSGGFCHDAPFTQIDGTPFWYCRERSYYNDRVVDFTLSGIEPEIFRRLGVNIDSNKLDTRVIFNDTYGIAVTKPLRDALQAAQGLDVGSIKAHDMPSLSRIQIASLLNGNITNWNQFTLNGAGLPSLSIIPAPPVNSRVQICRSVDSSATQIQADIFFNNYPCGGTDKSSVDNTLFSSPFDGQTADDNLNPLPYKSAVVHEFYTRENVRRCLNVLSSANAWGIGVVKVSDFSYKTLIRIDKATPLLEHVANTNYGDWFPTVMSWRNSSASVPPTGDKLTMLQSIARGVGLPSILYNNVNKENHVDLYSYSTKTQGGVIGSVFSHDHYSNPESKIFSWENPIAYASYSKGTQSYSPFSSCFKPRIRKDVDISVNWDLEPW